MSLLHSALTKKEKQEARESLSPGTATPMPKKSKTRMTVTMLAVMLLVSGGGAAWLLNRYVGGLEQAPLLVISEASPGGDTPASLPEQEITPVMSGEAMTAANAAPDETKKHKEDAATKTPPQPDGTVAAVYDTIQEATRDNMNVSQPEIASSSQDVPLPAAATAAPKDAAAKAVVKPAPIRAKAVASEVQPLPSQPGKKLTPKKKTLAVPHEKNHKGKQGKAAATPDEPLTGQTAPATIAVEQTPAEKNDAKPSKEEVAASFLNKANTYHSQGLFSRAAGLYREVLRHSPGNHGARIGLSATLVKMGRFDEAGKILGAIATSAQNTPEFLINSAIVALGQNDADRCLALLQKAEGFADPPLFAIFFHRGLAYVRKNNPQQAFFWYEKARSIIPNDEDLLFNMAIASDKKYDYDQAISLYQRLLDINGPGTRHRRKEIMERIRELRAARR